MKIIMVNEYGNCVKIAESEKQMYEYERLGFKKYVEPTVTPTVDKTEQEQEPRSKAKPKTTRKKAVKANG